MTIPTITPLPTAPQRTDAPSVFVTLADAFMAALGLFGTETNAMVAATNIAADQITIDAASCAANSASAIAAANVTIWITSTAYAIGDVHFSPANGINYRCNTATTDTTDPSTNSKWDIYNDSVADQIADASPGTGTTHTFDYANGQMQEITCPAAGTLTLAFDNMPSGVLGAFMFKMVNGGNCAITYPASTEFAASTYPSLTVAGTDFLAAYLDSAGTLVISGGLVDLGVP